jgi:hypothetical protein
MEVVRVNEFSLSITTSAATGQAMVPSLTLNSMSHFGRKAIKFESQTLTVPTTTLGAPSGHREQLIR